MTPKFLPLFLLTIFLTAVFSPPIYATGTKGYEENCIRDSECAEGLFCRGEATRIITDSACCYEGEEYDFREGVWGCHPEINRENQIEIIKDRKDSQTTRTNYNYIEGKLIEFTTPELSTQYSNLDEINFVPKYKYLIEEKTDYKRGDSCEDNLCGDVLECRLDQNGENPVCCGTDEINLLGLCISYNEQNGQVCNSDDQCLSSYCSLMPEDFYDENGKDLEYEKDSGFCCSQGTDWDEETQSCIEGGTFFNEGQEGFCTEKTQKGGSCLIGESICQSNDECQLGSYCSDGTCEKLEGNMCELCGEGFWNSCDERECNSLGACEFLGGWSNKCEEKEELSHNDLTYTGLGCGINLFARESAKFDFSTCCYEWERQGRDGRCEIDCDDEFCDRDKDKHDDRTEMKFWSNPMIKSDTAYDRVVDSACDDPFMHDNWKYKGYGIFNAGFLTGLLTDADNLVYSIPSLVKSGITQNFDNPTTANYGVLIGLISGLLYGVFDDLKSIFWDLPKLAVQLIGKLGSLIGDQFSDDEQQHIEENLVKEVEKEGPGFWAGMIETVSDRSEKTRLDFGSDCNDVTYTKSYTKYYTIGWVVEQLFFLATGGGVLKNSGVGLSKLGTKVVGNGAKFTGKTLQVAGKTAEYTGRYILLADFEFSKAFNLLEKKAVKKFGDDIFKALTPKQQRASVVLTDIWSKDTKFWNSLSSDQLQTATKNLDDLIAKSDLSESQLKAFLKSSEGRNALLEIPNAGFKDRFGKKGALRVGSEFSSFNFDIKNAEEIISQLKWKVYNKKTDRNYYIYYNIGIKDGNFEVPSEIVEKTNLLDEINYKINQKLKITGEKVPETKKGSLPHPNTGEIEEVLIVEDLVPNLEKLRIITNIKQIKGNTFYDIWEGWLDNFNLKPTNENFEMFLKSDSMEALGYEKEQIMEILIRGSIRDYLFGGFDRHMENIILTDKGLSFIDNGFSFGHNEFGSKMSVGFESDEIRNFQNYKEFLYLNYETFGDNTGPWYKTILESYDDVELAKITGEEVRKIKNLGENNFREILLETDTNNLISVEEITSKLYSKEGFLETYIGNSDLIVRKNDN